MKDQNLTDMLAKKDNIQVFLARRGCFCTPKGINMCPCVPPCSDLMAEIEKIDQYLHEHHERSMSWLKSLCAETEVLCRAKGLNGLVTVFSEAQFALKNYLMTPLFAEVTYEQSWEKGADLCQVEATRLTEIGGFVAQVKILRTASEEFKKFKATMAKANEKDGNGCRLS